MSERTFVRFHMIKSIRKVENINIPHTLIYFYLESTTYSVFPISIVTVCEPNTVELYIITQGCQVLAKSPIQIRLKNPETNQSIWNREKK